MNFRSITFAYREQKKRLKGRFLMSLNSSIFREEQVSIERCGNNRCQRPFSVSEYSLSMPGTKEREDITCPHCRHTYTEMSNGFFQTQALSPEEEAAFNLKSPL
jgi:hypothetical protein